MPGGGSSSFRVSPNARRDAYRARREGKFASEQAKMDRIMALAEGESPLGILRKLRELDDNRR